MLHISRFHLRRTTYIKTLRLGWLLICAFLLLTVAALLLSSKLLMTYTHVFTPYLKWQDALLLLLWFIAFLCVGVSIQITRFLFALRAGYQHGVAFFNADSSLTVRDLSAENLLAILQVAHRAFWCFVVVLLGLMPLVALSWTRTLTPWLLALGATTLVVVLACIGVVVSLVTLTFIVIGCIGSIRFTRDLGAPRTYSNQASLYLDRSTLTVTLTGTPESSLDLDALDPEDQKQLLSLLRAHWIDMHESSLSVEDTYEGAVAPSIA